MSLGYWTTDRGALTLLLGVSALLHPLGLGSRGHRLVVLARPG
ncbi:hypothetical protein [Pseudomonas asplenii]|nr:hypothetical protein [Pseudomonas fuscovaginae]